MPYNQVLRYIRTEQKDRKMRSGKKSKPSHSLPPIKVTVMVTQFLKDRGVCNTTEGNRVTANTRQGGSPGERALEGRGVPLSGSLQSHSRCGGRPQLPVIRASDQRGSSEQVTSAGLHAQLHGTLGNGDFSGSFTVAEPQPSRIQVKFNRHHLSISISNFTLFFSGVNTKQYTRDRRIKQ